ncbi:MAG: hypothetical protein K9N51_07425, partial [Candidatus Pacebacteria bacterium]|nr:hypothetical protein [Candidatus Paceibacterota bacterium]
MWTIDLTGNEWNVRQEDDESAPCRASVPGCVHMDLMREGRIEDPFYRDNETDLMWVGEKTWIYERTFMVDSALLRRTCILLQCEGLDTLATIEINGQTVGSANNMFRLWEYDIRDALREGENTIAVRFDSALSYGREQQSGDRYKWCGGAAHRLDGGNQVRKEQCNFGWDWGPMCVTCGIWRPIRVLAMDIVRLTDVQIHQYHAPSGDVELDVALTVDQVDRSVPLQAHVSVCYEGETVAKQSGLELTNGRGWVSLHIPDPHLWWPNGMGDQHLYTVWVELQDATGRDLDRAEKRVGLRTLELVQKLDQWGQSFYFAANGVPFYAKGANWIPGDVFQARMTDERYRYLLESARHANMNMLRVWGGGIYEEDAFYNMCDELGLCVWQDFMFACACYPAEDDTFMDNCREEFVQNVRRLRHHPSLAIWCGNNELEQMHVMNDDGSDGKMKWVDYSRLFDMLIPSVLRDEDPDRPYIPSSEHSPVGNREDSSNPNWGDAHLWSVWHGRQPFEWYRTTFHRFCSEFGFQSFPEPLTVDTYTLPKDRNITSPVMEHQQRS